MESFLVKEVIRLMHLSGILVGLGMIMMFFMDTRSFRHGWIISQIITVVSDVVADTLMAFLIA